MSEEDIYKQKIVFFIIYYDKRDNMKKVFYNLQSWTKRVSERKTKVINISYEQQQ